MLLSFVSAPSHCRLREIQVRYRLFRELSQRRRYQRVVQVLRTNRRPNDGEKANGRQPSRPTAKPCKSIPTTLRPRLESSRPRSFSRCRGKNTGPRKWWISDWTICFPVFPDDSQIYFLKALRYDEHGRSEEARYGSRSVLTRIRIYRLLFPAWVYGHRQSRVAKRQGRILQRPWNSIRIRSCERPPR